MINFNISPYIGTEEKYISEAIKSGKICGDGPFTKKCQRIIEEYTGTKEALLTNSGTDSLEMSAILAGITSGDEVIMPSYTFVSTANAFVLRGAKIVFVDIRPDTMNIDENLIEGAITNKTKAIVPVHYAGVACEMDTINEIAKKHNIKVIEDAAQGVMAFYKGKALGSIGDYGCFSFHETKNYSMGEGGAILINKEDDLLRGEIIREKGTNRSQFFRGQVDKYSWMDVGSSFLPSELNAAYLYAQLLEKEAINNNRLASWDRYYKGLLPLKNKGVIELPYIPQECTHNAHMFYIKTKDLEERTALINHLKNRDIASVFHYVPLHSAPAGKKYGVFYGKDIYTTKESERLLRLPMYYNLSADDIDKVVEGIFDFYKG
ncbi:MAG: dTDP-4-amino-4,6-dideoxygalactose transaminase [Acutalibacteraceae bacterium]|nr:dTDP-4-amino-4,6-dideoxygalactose transaminase [Acutalibacteraceae bacterium]